MREEKDELRNSAKETSNENDGDSDQKYSDHSSDDDDHDEDDDDDNESRKIARSLDEHFFHSIFASCARDYSPKKTSNYHCCC